MSPPEYTIRLYFENEAGARGHPVFEYEGNYYAAVDGEMGQCVRLDLPLVRYLADEQVFDFMFIDYARKLSRSDLLPIKAVLSELVGRDPAAWPDAAERKIGHSVLASSQ